MFRRLRAARRGLALVAATTVLATVVPASPAGARPAPLAQPRWVGEYEEANPSSDDFQIAFGPKGALLATDEDAGEVLLYNAKGDLVASIERAGGRDFANPRGVEVVGNRVYVADTSNGRVVVLDASLRYVSQFTVGGGAGSAFVQRIAALPNGNLVVKWSGSGGGFADIMTPSGTKVGALDIAALGDLGLGGYRTISGIEADAAGRIYDMQFGSTDGFIAVFTSGGALIRKIPLGRDFLNDIVIDDQGNIWGARRSFDAPFKAAVYSPTGQLLLEYLPNGSNPEQSIYSDSVALLPTGKVVQADRDGTFDVFAFATCGGRFATRVGTNGPDTIVGTRADDTIVALGGNDAIATGPGDDIICAGAGNDRVNAGEGNDVLAGEDGNDILLGKVGRDVLNGGPGTDACGGGAGKDKGVACETVVSIP